METFAVVVDLVVVAILAATLLAMPLLSRREFLFGITVPSALREQPEGHAILRGFAFGITGSAVGCALLVIAGGRLASGEVQVGWELGSVLLMLPASLAFYLRARARAARFAVVADRRREVVLAPGPQVVDVLPRPLAWHALPYLLLAGAGAWVALHWNAIPAVFPVHLDVDGRVNGYAHKSMATVFAPLAIGLLAVVLGHLTMLLGMVVRRLPDTLARARLLNAALLEFMCFLSLSFAWVALLPLYGMGLLAGTAGFTTFVSLLVAMILVPGITLVRGLRRLRASEPAGGRGDRTPDSAWILGGLYFNREDPSVFVEKRFGIGYTLNFAHPAAYILIVGILLVVVLILIGSLSAQTG
ncbi:MAG TPA: DUF5808 domain-containing protein [Gammaproteobacteria bacterium]